MTTNSSLFHPDKWGTVPQSKNVPVPLVPPYISLWRHATDDDVLTKTRAQTDGLLANYKKTAQNIL